jgi:hypothetical protein
MSKRIPRSPNGPALGVTTRVGNILELLESVLIIKRPREHQVDVVAARGCLINGAEPPIEPVE